MLSEVSDSERQILHDFIYMLNLKKGWRDTKEMNKEISTKPNTDNGLVVARGRVLMEWVKWVKEIKTYKLPYIK